MSKQFKYVQQVKLHDGTLLDIYEDIDKCAMFALESSFFESGQSFYSPYSTAPHLVDTDDDDLFDDSNEHFRSPPKAETS